LHAIHSICERLGPNSQVNCFLPPPLLGEHTTEILRSWGYTLMRLGALAAESAI
jgi:crotonobetainyl-CoA:carnitine CoA-transferase CaiB-like acyl-CoA transferase